MSMHFNCTGLANNLLFLLVDLVDSDKFALDDVITMETGYVILEGRRSYSIFEQEAL